MRWASAIGLGRDLDSAADEAREQIGGCIADAQPDLVIAFVSARYGAAMDRLPGVLEPWLGTGCSLAAMPAA